MIYAKEKIIKLKPKLFVVTQQKTTFQNHMRTLLKKKLLSIKNLLKKIADMLEIDLLKKLEVFTTIKKKQKVFMVE